MESILALKPPKNVRELRHVLGLVQFYRDIWEKRSDILAPLTNLVGECAVTKPMKKKGTKRKPFHWDESHQRAFDDMKATIFEKWFWPIQISQKLLKFILMRLLDN